MPTTLPVRTALPTSSVDLIDFARAMIFFYSVIAIPITIIIGIEYNLGMFHGLTLAEAFLKAAGPGLPYTDPQLIGMF